MKPNGTATIHCCLFDDGDFELGSNLIFDVYSTYPATKEQRDLLFTKMKEAGYEWDAEKKELKKIEQEQTELPKGEDYGIDSLYHAVRILEKTLGEVEGYQSDDGILGHKCAIEAVKRLYEQKATWSEDDEETLNNILNDLSQNVIPDDEDTQWLKSLKERMTWRPTEEQLSHLQAAIEECGYNQVLESLYKDLKKL